MTKGDDRGEEWEELTTFDPEYKIDLKSLRAVCDTQK